MLGLIGGSGFERLVDDGARISIRTAATPYGDATLEEVRTSQGAFVFWSRHGTEHEWPPHRIPARAGMWALRQAGVTRIVATAAVGTLHPSRFPVGSLALVSDVMDFTRSGRRERTFFDGPPLPVVHLDASHLYCRALGASLRTLRDPHTPLEDVILAVTEGPRLETPAEIRALSRLGADVVGMTGVPEVVLARELGMCYVGLAVLTNPAAGLADTVDGALIDAYAKRAQGEVLALVRGMVAEPALCDAPCACQAQSATEAVRQVMALPVPAGSAS